MKNHRKIDGKLLNLNKEFAQLKASQQEQIQKWLLEEYLKIIGANHRLLSKTEKEMVVETAYRKIQAADMWIPYAEVSKYFSGKLNQWNKKYIE